MTLQTLPFLCPFVRRQVHMSVEDKVPEEDAAAGRVSSREGRIISSSRPVRCLMEIWRAWRADLGVADSQKHGHDDLRVVCHDEQV